MTSSNLAPIPRVTSSASGQWPVLAPTFQDMHWQPAKVLAQSQPTRSARPRRRLHLHRRLPAAALKGAVVAAVVIGIVAGVLPAQVWWLSGWHWAGGLMIVGSLTVLAGFDTGLVTVAAIADIQVVESLPAHLPLVASLAAGSILVRLCWELMLAVAMS